MNKLTTREIAALRKLTGEWETYSELRARLRGNQPTPTDLVKFRNLTYVQSWQLSPSKKLWCLTPVGAEFLRSIDAANAALLADEGKLEVKYGGD